MMFPMMILLFLLLLGYLYYKESQESGYMSDEDPMTLKSHNFIEDSFDIDLMNQNKKRWTTQHPHQENSINYAQTSFQPMDSVSLPVVSVESSPEDIQSQIMNDLLGVSNKQQEQEFTADAYNPMELRQAPPGGIPLIYPEDEYTKIASQTQQQQQQQQPYSQLIPPVREEVSSISKLQPQSI
jgi:hypothetical protein